MFNLKISHLRLIKNLKLRIENLSSSILSLMKTVINSFKKGQFFIRKYGYSLFIRDILKIFYCLASEGQKRIQILNNYYTHKDYFLQNISAMI